MKKTDIAMIVLIAGVSVMAAYGVASAIPVLKTSNLKATVPTVKEIKSDVAPVDSRLFGEGALNPTQQTIVGNK